MAYHATRLKVKSTIVMPRPTPLIKVVNMRDLGGEVVLHGANYDEALAYARAIAEEEGMTFIHAFDDEAVIAGQGTIGLELREEDVAFDAVVGWLAAGVDRRRRRRDEGNPPEYPRHRRRAGVLRLHEAALGASESMYIATQPTIADGLAVNRAGERTIEIARRYVDDIVTVSEDEIASAILKLLEIEKTVVEAKVAVPLAAVLFNKIAGIEGKNVAIIVSGGNIDPNLLSKIIERGLAKDGRMAASAFWARPPRRTGPLCQHAASSARTSSK